MKARPFLFLSVSLVPALGYFSDNMHTFYTISSFLLKSVARCVVFSRSIDWAGFHIPRHVFFPLPYDCFTGSLALGCLSFLFPDFYSPDLFFPFWAITID